MCTLLRGGKMHNTPDSVTATGAAVLAAIATHDYVLVRVIGLFVADVTPAAVAHLVTTLSVGVRVTTVRFRRAGSGGTQGRCPRAAPVLELQASGRLVDVDGAVNHRPTHRLAQPIHGR